MAIELYDNATAQGTTTSLVDSITAFDDVLPVADIASPALQDPAGQFRVAVINLQNGKIELMMVTANAWTPNWTVTRGIEDTDPIDFPIGSIVKHIITAGALKNLISLIQAEQTSTPATQQGGSYTFKLSDAGSVVESTSAVAVTFTIPDHSVVPFPVGATIEVFQRGGGKVNIAAGSSSVHLLSPAGLTHTASQNSTIGLRQSDVNDWVLSGNLG